MTHWQLLAALFQSSNIYQYNHFHYWKDFQSPFLISGKNKIQEWSFENEEVSFSKEVHPRLAKLLLNSIGGLTIPGSVKEIMVMLCTVNPVAVYYSHAIWVEWHSILPATSCFECKTIFLSIGILIIKVRQLWDYLIFIMRIPIPVRHHFEMAHRLSRHTSNRISKLFITGSQCGEISPVVSPHKWPIMQISFLCDSIIMTTGLRSSGVWMLTHQSMAFESHTRLFHSPNISAYCGPSQQQTSGSGILVQFYHAPRFLLWR